MKAHNGIVNSFLAGLLAFIYISLVNACSTPDGYIINGTVTGARDGAVTLTYEYNYKQYTDSAIMKDGKFTLKGKLPEPLLCTMTLPEGNTRTFFAGNAKMQVEGFLVSFHRADVSGSREQDLYNGYLEEFEKAIAVRRRSSNVNNSSVSSAEETAEMQTLNDSITKAFVQANPGSSAAAWHIYANLLQSFPEKAAALFELLNDKGKRSCYGQFVDGYLRVASRTEVGAVPPDLFMPDSTGKNVSLADLKGKYVVLRFRTSEQLQYLNDTYWLNLYNRYHSKGVAFVSVTVNADRQQWLAAIRAANPPGIQLLSNQQEHGPLLDSYGIQPTPLGTRMYFQRLLIDKDGRILMRDPYDVALEKMLDQLLGR